MNPASSFTAEAAFSRDRANQPVPIFPRSPGIILKRLIQTFVSINHFVLSMNGDEIIRNFASGNELICTACSPESAARIIFTYAFHPMFMRVRSAHEKLLTAPGTSETAAVNKFAERLLRVTRSRKHNCAKLY